MEKSFFTLVLVIISLLYSSPVNSQIKYHRLEFDVREDIIGQIARNFLPRKNFEQWALLKGNNSSKNTSVLFNNSEMEEINFVYLPEGFFNACHPTGCSYYIIAKENDEIIYIDDKEKLLNFLGNIDIVEEALLIAIINGFQVDSNDERGSSYRMTSNAFEFLLMKSNYFKIQYQQYFVVIDKYGRLESEAREVYCEGFQDCHNR